MNIKLKNRLFSFLLIICFVFSLFSSNLQVVNASSNLNSTINDISNLEELAKDWIETNNSSKDYLSLVLGYICNGGYNDIWASYEDSNDSNFSDYVDKNAEKDLSYLKTLDTISNSSSKVDFKLLMNSINVLRSNNSIYCNWGYLVSNSIISHGVDNSDVDTLINSVTFINDTSKINAIMDAVNIANSIYSKSLSEVLTTYYNSVSSDSRIRNFTSQSLGVSNISKNNLRDVIYSKFSNDSVIINVLGTNNISLSNSENLIKANCYAFADYIYNNHPDAIQEPVNIPIETIEIKDFPEELKVGDEKELSINILPENASSKEYKITSNNDNIVSIIDNNKIKAIGQGEATITISGIDTNISKEYKITIYQNATKITSSQTKYTLNLGDTIKLDYKLDNNSNEKVIWECNSPYATVNTDGTVISKACGVATVYCKLESNDSIYCSYEITIKSLMDSISITNKQSKNDFDYNGIILKKGENYSLVVAVTPENESNNISFSSDDENICTIENGTIKAINYGETTITVFDKNDETKKDSVNVYVLGPVSKVSFSKKTLEFNIKDNSEMIVKPTFSPIYFDEEMIDFISYRIDDNDKISKDFSNISYDYKTGKLNVKKAGEYKIVCIDVNSQEELGSFSVVVKDKSTNEPLYNLDPESGEVTQVGKDNNLIGNILICSIIVIVIIIIITAIYFYKHKDDYEDDEEILEDETSKEDDKNSKITNLSVEDIMNETMNNTAEEIKNLEQINTNNELTDDELDVLIEEISEKIDLEDNDVLEDSIIKNIEESVNLEDSNNDSIENLDKNLDNEDYLS